MTYQAYEDRKFTKETLDLIEKCNAICNSWMRQGYVMTVRQLYYQLVARAIVPNTVQSYKRVADIVNNARMAGMISWDAIEDRTRDFIERTRWTSPRQIITASHDSYHMDMWANQEVRVFVVVEKEALTGILEPVCDKFDVPLLAARGYASSSVLRTFARQKVMRTLADDKDVILLYLGDHDPSGIDMTRDLDEKMHKFAEAWRYRNRSIDVRRIALTMEQIDDQAPPPNPAKATDSRFNGYYDLYGDESWELDALSPSFIDNLVTEQIEKVRDEHAWDARQRIVSTLRDEIGGLVFQATDEDGVQKMIDEQNGEDDES
jgi:hypothetical protein